MIYTAKKLIEKYPTTLYKNEEKQWYDYKMAMGDFFKLSDNFKNFEDFKTPSLICNEIKKLKMSEEYMDLKSKIKSTQELVKNAEKCKISEIRQQLKSLKTKQGKLKEGYIKLAYEKVAEGVEKLYFLEYKSTLAMSSFENICYFIPKLKSINCKWIKNMPVFTKNIAAMPLENLAIESGPCMFGTDEVMATITLKSGEKMEFDYNSGVCNTAKLLMVEFVQINAMDIVNIDYKRLKDGITSQEFEYFDAMFEIANALQIPLLISIPDMSYLKYFANSMHPLKADVYAVCYENYKKVLYEITDLFLEYIEKCKQKYNIPKIAVLQNRDKELMNIFNQKRESFLHTKNICKNEQKLDSISDYISMPAMPYYLWGIENIMEINSTDETDAIRKCMKNHKNVINFFPILIPEKVSRDGKTTIFEANRDYKDYVGGSVCKV